MPWRNLPEEMIFEILSWVPPRSLIRFRCVCKPWRSLISNPNFIQIHINRTTLNPNHNNNHDDDESLITFTAYDYALSLLRPKKSNSTFNLDPSFPDGKLNYINVVGSIHGLVCLCLGVPWDLEPSIFVLWNPATKHFKILAPPKIEMDPILVYNSASSTGFCFDPRSNDYKLVRTVRFAKEFNKSPWVELYSVASDSWREIKVEQIPFKFLGSRSHTIVKGEPYWKVHFDLDNGGTEVAVVWFDVGNEVFQQVPKQHMPAFDLESACLVNFRGSFAVVDSQGLSRLQSSILNERVTLWVMEDCFSWSMKFTVQLLLEFRTVPWCSMNGLVVVKHSGGVLLLYDPETGETHNFQIGGTRIDGTKAVSLNICNYTASLVPIEGSKQVRKEA